MRTRRLDTRISYLDLSHAFLGDGISDEQRGGVRGHGLASGRSTTARKGRHACFCCMPRRSLPRAAFNLSLCVTTYVRPCSFFIGIMDPLRCPVAPRHDDKDLRHRWRAASAMASSISTDHFSIDMGPLVYRCAEACVMCTCACVFVLCCSSGVRFSICYKVF